MTREELLQEIDRYLQAREMSAREFSVQATGDSGLVSRLRHNKANITWRTERRLLDYINKHKVAAE